MSNSRVARLALLLGLSVAVTRRRSGLDDLPILAVRTARPPSSRAEAPAVSPSSRAARLGGLSEQHWIRLRPERRRICLRLDQRRTR